VVRTKAKPRGKKKPDKKFSHMPTLEGIIPNVVAIVLGSIVSANDPNFINLPRPFGGSVDKACK
jgi:hypothetical protein